MKKAFSLIEILVVIAIIGMLGAMVVPKLQDILETSKTELNKATMQDIKRAALDFKSDVGFVPDSVTLLIHPFENCTVSSDHNTSNSSTCRSMIAFVDSRLTLTNFRKSGGECDYGKLMCREQVLIDEIKRRLEIKNGGWRGSYIGGNGHLVLEQIKTLGGTNESGNRYFLSKKDIDLYYDGFDVNDTLVDVGITESEAKRWFPIEASDFNGTRGGGAINEMDILYDTAKYRESFIGELTIFDTWGTPYEIQFPIVASGSRERFARVVSFGKNRQRDTEVTDFPIDTTKKNYDDSVLYIYDNNQSSYFHISEQ